jgi:hypothetical protein
MGFVTKDQLERARRIPVLDYVLLHEQGQFKRVGNSYRLRSDDSLVVGKEGWYCHKRTRGSRTALDYLVEIKGYGLVEAVCTLLGEQPHERGKMAKAETPVCTATQGAEPPTKPISSDKPPPERMPFAPPLRNKDNRRVIAYLQSRGIDRDSILACIDQGALYESAIWHNCVFTGKDENGKTRYAALRGTTSAFVRDADGSDKKYGFTIPPDNPDSREAAIFESPIDCLSHQTLCKLGFIPPFDGWRLSLGGTSDLALKHLLKIRPEIVHCLICTDNDEFGNAIAAKIAAMPDIGTERSLPVIGNDWNDTLQYVQKAERVQGKAHDNAPII